MIVLTATLMLLSNAFVIEGAKVFTGDNGILENANVLVENDRIVQVGNFVPPAHATRIDARGKILTPGLIESRSLAGVSEVDAVESSLDYSMEGQITPALFTGDGFNPNSVWIPVLRKCGITHAIVRPFEGLLAGTAAWVSLQHASSSTQPVAIFGDATHVKHLGGSRGALWLTLTHVLEDARFLMNNTGAVDSNRARTLAAPLIHLRALAPVLRKSMPLVLDLNRASDIVRAVQFAKSNHINLIISGGAESWMVAETLKEAQVPVIVEGSGQMPEAFDRLAAVDDLAARLHYAGVTIMISRGGRVPERLRQDAGFAIANGLPEAAAMRAITSTPAKIFGHPETGSIAPGKMANLVLWSADPFDTQTTVLNMWVNGTPQSTITRQDLLARRYLSK